MVGGCLTIALGLLAASDLDRAITLYRERNFAAAETEFRRLVSREGATARLYLVRTLLEQNRIAEALAELELTLANSKDPDVQFEAGQIARKLAERRLADLEGAAPNSAAVREFAGRQLEAKGKNEEALKEYQVAANLNPQRPGIHYRIGNIFWRMRRLEDAQRELAVELAASPHHGMANLRLGQALILKSEEARAVAPLESAVRAMPDSIEARKELGKAYRKVGRTADARREWEAVAKTRPGDDQIHFLLGGLYRELGEEGLSRREFGRHREILERQRALAEKK